MSGGCWLATASSCWISGIEIDDIEAEISRLEAEGKTAMLVAVDGTLAGVVGVADTVKPESAVPLRR